MPGLSVPADLEDPVTTMSLPTTADPAAAPASSSDPANFDPASLDPSTSGPEYHSDPEYPSDLELLTLIHDQPRGSAARADACEILVTRYQSLVRSCARRYQGSPESADELMQVGYVGLMKAINRFDPAAGTSLAPYALACVSGEIKRHFRDRRWQVRVKRSSQELVMELRTATAELAQQLQATPTDEELAAHLRVSMPELDAARSADLGFSAWSLDAPLSDQPEAGSLGELLGAEDPHMEHAVDMAALGAHWNELPERQQRILLLRFYGNMTQAEIGEQIGLSQMHVSRLITQSLAYLRDRMLGADLDEAPETSRAA
jgi:RNA polymerase sigma-B factor